MKEAREAFIRSLSHDIRTPLTSMLSYTELLEKILVNNLGSREFFINKAIGWSLRDYSKTDSEWVRDFIRTYGEKMDMLSVREGSKYL